MSGKRGEYGVDAPYAPIGMLVGALFALSGAVFGQQVWLYAVAALVALFAVLYLHTTRRGKFLVWDEVLDGLPIGGAERVLDLGCGRGAVLLNVARRLTTGRAVGVDLWRSVDQSGNAVRTTARNAVLEGVEDRVELHTGDLRELPFEDAGFDLVLSSLAIHNIKDAGGRARAVEEAVRVLRPGGRLVIADISATGLYRRRLTELGMAEVRDRGLGWRMWWGGPWMPTRLVTATKPVSSGPA
ncbi:class I SAM-dependent methyltransferase [Kutzneria viridogrisea]|uniref:Methyltransferase type 11 domain-containing protein n=2 Tax=Kutzneria TaxID=43356 RepID=W5WK20_9PSEU|nr:class I SAM-dependent methyltransferase [Kutzneria albida]AHI01096.1 hypothetical protein KALB_7738 [Kutzneria albida DSM 43870]MBA8926351.1 SAM-dependent methyltransferase [Kutzneria viridogrisea]